MQSRAIRSHQTHTHTHAHRMQCMPRRITWASLMMNIGRLEMSAATVVDSLETNSKAQNSSSFCIHFVCASVARRSIHPNSTNYIHENLIIHFHEINGRYTSSFRLHRTEIKKKETRIEQKRCSHNNSVLCPALPCG